MKDFGIKEKGEALCKCGGCDRRPHADMSNSMLYSALSRYMSDP
jgi:hypothetical protein